ncbi:MAG: mannose-1-phosphate guanylyltransferase/mannose-6-phosphate isomerase [Pseudomonadales bacterium]|nr:mannose-1-phosphate guanylyltransferase/mannose-6-phosphate isomerase [Pseudomonadales bacterium]
MIIPVILAGGAGSRLWPVSRESFPKQFITFQAGSGSLFQETLCRLRGLAGIGAPIVICNQDHRFLVAEQLRAIGISDARILLEPVGRNTAPALALAALEAQKDGTDPVLLVLAADHLIQDVGAFQQVLGLGRQQAEAGHLVTFGIVPTAPETGYGYIRRGQAQGAGFRIERFVEKPDGKTAGAYLASGEYYWNSGMFMFNASNYLQELAASQPTMLSVCRDASDGSTRDLDFIRIPAAIFEHCPADSIDYAVMEKTRKGLVLPLDAGWSDLGAWSALWEQGPHDDQGNVVSGDTLLQDVRNSYIHADFRLVSVLGLDDAVVIETRDAVLVSSRHRVQDVKTLVSRLKNAQRSEADSHRLVYRPWGSYEGLASAEGFQVKRIVVKPGASLSLQLHHHRAEHWIVVQGTARVTCGEDVFMLGENESTFIPVETRHRLENPGIEPIILIEVQCGTYLGEDDIVRFEDIYGREAQT